MKQGYIYINENIFQTLLACSPDEQAKGLMFESAPTPIMSFIYKSASINKFWMKSTPSPLDIIFTCNGKVTEICQGVPFSTASIGSDSPSDLIIEMPLGTAKSSNIKLGQKVGLINLNVGELLKLQK